LWDRRFRKRKSRLTKVMEQYERSKNKREFSAKHKNELFEYKRIHKFQGKLSKYRRTINLLKGRDEQTPAIKKRIKDLEQKRIELIKKYLNK